MAYAGVLDDIRRCIRLEEPGRTPFFALSEEFDVRLSGLIYADYNSKPELLAGCQIDAVRRMDYDWAWLQVDDCIEFEVLGVGVKGSGNILPATCDYLPATRETLRSLPHPDFHRAGRMPVLLDALCRVKQEFGDTVCVVGRVAAPFSSVTLLYGMTETMLLLYDDPELVQETVRWFIDFQTAWGLAQIQAGADALWVGDCNASGHLISVDQYREFAAEGVRACVSAYHAAGGMSFYHASEHKIEHMMAQAETGIQVLSIGPGADLAEAKRTVGKKVCLLGNLDPIECLLQGSPDDVAEQSRRILALGRPGGGYIFNSGEMIPRDVPIENMRAMARAAGKHV